MSINIGEPLLDAFDIGVEAWFKKAGFDTTVIATILQDEHKNNKYKVTDNGQEYYAYSYGERGYKEGDQVFILIPRGDRNNEKYIIGKAKNIEEDEEDSSLQDYDTNIAVGKTFSTNLTLSQKSFGRDYINSFDFQIKKNFFPLLVTGFATAQGDDGESSVTNYSIRWYDKEKNFINSSINYTIGKDVVFLPKDDEIDSGEIIFDTGEATNNVFLDGELIVVPLKFDQGQGDLIKSLNSTRKMALQAKFKITNLETYYGNYGLELVLKEKIDNSKEPLEDNLKLSTYLLDINNFIGNPYDENIINNNIQKKFISLSQDIVSIESLKLFYEGELPENSSIQLTDATIGIGFLKTDFYKNSKIVVTQAPQSITAENKKEIQKIEVSLSIDDILVVQEEYPGTYTWIDDNNFNSIFQEERLNNHNFCSIEGNILTLNNAECNGSYNCYVIFESDDKEVIKQSDFITVPFELIPNNNFEIEEKGNFVECFPYWDARVSEYKWQLKNKENIEEETFAYEVLKGGTLSVTEEANEWKEIRQNDEGSSLTLFTPNSKSFIIKQDDFPLIFYHNNISNPLAEIRLQLTFKNSLNNQQQGKTYVLGKDIPYGSSYTYDEAVQGIPFKPDTISGIFQYNSHGITEISTYFVIYWTNNNSNRNQEFNAIEKRADVDFYWSSVYASQYPVLGFRFDETNWYSKLNFEEFNRNAGFGEEDGYDYEVVHSIKNSSAVKETLWVKYIKYVDKKETEIDVEIDVEEYPSFSAAFLANGMATEDFTNIKEIIFGLSQKKDENGEYIDIGTLDIQGNIVKKMEKKDSIEKFYVGSAIKN